jgi:YHS domain-containing protein
MLDHDFSMTIAGLRVEESSYTIRFLFTEAKEAQAQSVHAANTYAHNTGARNQSHLNVDSLKMPAAASLTRAQSLYLTSGGAYTEDDIEANGRTTAATKYASFVAQHDPNPVAGDWLCPITLTKANPDCAWIIAGETYYFCCPPCIDEFLEQAKSTPERITGPAAYKQATGN